MIHLKWPFFCKFWKSQLAFSYFCIAFLQFSHKCFLRNCTEKNHPTCETRQTGMWREKPGKQKYFKFNFKYSVKRKWKGTSNRKPKQCSSRPLRRECKMTMIGKHHAVFPMIHIKKTTGGEIPRHVRSPKTNGGTWFLTPLRLTPFAKLKNRSAENVKT